MIKKQQQIFVILEFARKFWMFSPVASNINHAYKFITMEKMEGAMFFEPLNTNPLKFLVNFAK